MTEQIHEIITLAIRLVAMCLTLLATRYAIPWLKEQATYATVKKLVQAAEKLACAGTITKDTKKQYVITLLQRRGIKIDEQINALIESAVEELDWMSGEIYKEFEKDDDDPGKDVPEDG